MLKVRIYWKMHFMFCPQFLTLMIMFCVILTSDHYEPHKGTVVFIALMLSGHHTVIYGSYDVCVSVTRLPVQFI